MDRRSEKFMEKNDEIQTQELINTGGAEEMAEVDRSGK